MKDRSRFMNIIGEIAREKYSPSFISLFLCQMVKISIYIHELFIITQARFSRKNTSNEIIEKIHPNHDRRLQGRIVLKKRLTLFHDRFITDYL